MNITYYMSDHDPLVAYFNEVAEWLNGILTEKVVVVPNAAGHCALVIIGTRSAVLHYNTTIGSDRIPAVAIRACQTWSATMATAVMGQFLFQCVVEDPNLWEKTKLAIRHVLYLNGVVIP